MNEVITKINNETLIRGIEATLDEVRPSLQMHGGNAEVMKVEDGVVHLKLEGSCHGCPMSVITFGVALKEMLQERFPNDVKDVVWSEPQDEIVCCAKEV